MHAIYLHIGDYMKDTAHLSILEDGAYNRMLRVYYSTESPLPSANSAVHRIVGCKTPQERKSVDVLLSEFFVLESDGWHHKRCDAEIAKVREKSQKARDSAAARWESERIANALRTDVERNASHKPLTSNHINPTTKAVAESQKPLNGNHSAVDLAVALRSKGVKVNGTHPDVINLAEQGITQSTALEAVRIAQEERGKTNPTINYLLPIIRDLTTGPTKKPSATMNAIMKLEAMKNEH
jgi:uncharacterized protein YdaU (DUF1376 family)